MTVTTSVGFDSLVSETLAIDFVNTVQVVRARRIDSLDTNESLRAFMDAAGLLERRGSGDAMTSPAVGRLVYEEAHRLRAEVRRLFSAHSGRALPRPETLFAINRVLGSSARTSVLETKDGALTVVELETRDAGNAMVLLAPIALAAVELVTRVAPTRLRECAAPDCTTWFVDSSKGGRRRWCSMARCGNRTKAARHRQRNALPPEAPRA